MQLPYHWDRHNQGQQGSATFVIPFDLAPPGDEPYELYLPRIGNAYELWLNGVLLQRRGDLLRPDSFDSGKAPRRAEVQAGVLGPHNELRIVLRADAGRRAGLAPVTLGPADEVEARYQAAYAAQTGGSMAVVVLSLLVAATAFALWLTQSDARMAPLRRERLYLFVGVAEASWALRLCDSLLEQPPLPWPQWSLAMAIALACWAGGMLVFSCDVAGWGQRLGRRASAVFWAFPATALAGGVLGTLLHSSLPLAVFYALVAAVFIVFSIAFCRAALVPGASTGHRLLALALAINSVVGLRDTLVFRFSDGYGATTWIRYSSVLFGLALAYIVIDRFRTASAQASDLMANLAARVAQKEAELSASYEQLGHAMREQARASERSRVLRDMHDGVGAHLSAAIRQLQSDRVDSAQVAQTLRDALQQLKLSIDAMNLAPGDVTALLAGLRYRLEPRFADSDLRLEWAVDELPPIPRLDYAAMRHLQFMVFEALSNVLQHARARVLRIEATLAGGGARLRIIDDGAGFQPAAAGQAGLRTLRDRADAIGADLALDSRAGRTVVEIFLPA